MRGNKDFEDAVVTKLQTFPYCTISIGIYVLTLTTFSFLVVRLGLKDSWLYLFIVPSILSAYYFKRRIYLSMQGALVVAAIWVTSLVSSDFSTSLTTIVVSAFSSLIVAEVIHALVTARKQAEKALQSKTNEQALLLDTMEAQVWYLTDSETYGTVNRSHAQFLGLKREEIEYKKLIEFVSEEVAQVCEESNREVFEKKKTIHTKEWVPNAQGEKHLIAITKTPYLDQDGNVEYIVCVGTDITEYKQTEEALRESQERLELALRGGDLGTWDWDIRTSEVQFNNRWAELKGYAPGEIKPHLSSWENLVHPDDLSFVYKKLNAHLAGETPFYEAEFRMQHKSGHWIWILDRGKVIEWDAAGNPVRVCGTHLDITKRKRAEERLRQRVSQLAVLNDIGAKIAGTLDLDALLEKTVRLVQESFDYHHVSIFTLGSEGRRFLMRAGTGDIAHLYPVGHSLELGQGVVGWVGQQGETLLVNDVDADPRYVNKYPDQILTQSELSVPIQIGEKVVGVLDLQSDHRHAFDQNDILVMETVADQIAVAIENARLYEAEQAMRQNLEDLVEERTQALRDAQEQLIRKERLAALGQLAGGIAHELRQPLSTISNVAFLLKSTKTNPDEETAKHMAMLDDEVHHANHIITDLLEFARTGEAKPTSIPVENLVKRVFEKHPPPDGLTTEINIPDDLPLALIDPGHLNQVLANLVTNAYQAMPEGGQLSVDCEQDTVDRLLITVSDTGTGIPPEHLDEIFEPLFTTKQKGIGLGLALSKSLVEANNGRIEVQSQMGERTTFRVYLPITRKTGS